MFTDEKIREIIVNSVTMDVAKEMSDGFTDEEYTPEFMFEKMKQKDKWEMVQKEKWKGSIERYFYHEDFDDQLKYMFNTDLKDKQIKEQYFAAE